MLLIDNTWLKNLWKLNPTKYQFFWFVYCELCTRESVFFFNLFKENLLNIVAGWLWPVGIPTDGGATVGGGGPCKVRKIFWGSYLLRCDKIERKKSHWPKKQSESFGRKTNMQINGPYQSIHNPFNTNIKKIKQWNVTKPFAGCHTVLFGSGINKGVWTLPSKVITCVV